VPNGIPDPCPDFNDSLRGDRENRRKELRQSDPDIVYRVAFLGHCHKGKGLWDAMRAITIANQRLAGEGRKIRLKLTIAGEFPNPADRDLFHEMSAESGPEQFEYVGFVGGREKRVFLEWADCLCFPTKYEAESFGLVAVEALAFGIPPVCSDWRMLPDLMKMVGLPVAETGNPESLAEKLIESIGRDAPESLRASFCDHFSDRRHLETLADSLREASK
jgi:glycosyltransferase involved in cell wall biosynthesis